MFIHLFVIIIITIIVIVIYLESLNTKQKYVPDEGLELPRWWFWELLLPAFAKSNPYLYKPYLTAINNNSY